MTNFATKHVLEKRSSNGQLWSERLAGVTTQTKYHAYTVLEFDPPRAEPAQLSS